MPENVAIPFIAFTVVVPTSREFPKRLASVANRRVTAPLCVVSLFPLASTMVTAAVNVDSRGWTLGGCCVNVRRVATAGGATQLREYETVAVPPAGTLTEREVPPLTVQFEATPESWIVWPPAARSSKVMLWLIPIGWLRLPSTLT